MTWADHALAALLVVLSPVATLWSASRLARRIESGDAHARLRYYRSGTTQYWALALALGSLWHWTGRPFDALGIVATAGTTAWITAGLCAATVIFFATQIGAALTSEDARASVRVQLERSPGVRVVIPATAAEMRGFAAVSVTAASARSSCTAASSCGTSPRCCPEAGPSPRRSPSSASGTRIRACAACCSPAWSAVFRWRSTCGTGSLIAPIVMHAAVDLANGFIGYRAQARGEATLAPGGVAV